VLDAAGGVRVNRSLPSDLQAITAALDRQPVKAIAIEACCGAAAFGEQLATRGSWRVELAHPGYVARLKQSPDKTDYSDARLLADLTRVGYLPRVWLAPQEVRDLRQLVGHRVRLVDRRRAIKLQIGALLREQRVKLPSSRWSKAWLASLQDCALLSKQVQWVMNDLLEELVHVSGKIAKVEQRLREATAGHPLVARLRKIEGVGEVTAWMLAACIGRFDRFKTGKQLSRYCGLSPRNASSGKKTADAGLIDMANKPLRAVLIQAAHRLMRTDERWGRLAQSLLARGKPKPLVVAAVANRWVRSMHHRMVD
jgi:transposase